MNTIKKTSEYQKAWRERKKKEKEAYSIERRMAVEAVKDSFKETLKEIHSEEVSDFSELRGLALNTIREMLLNGKDREKMSAANMVLNRTDPERQQLNIDVSIHPIDISHYLIGQASQPVQVIDITEKELIESK